MKFIVVLILYISNHKIIFMRKYKFYHKNDIAVEKKIKQGHTI